MNELGQPIAQGRTAEIYAWGEGRVLKLYRAGYPRGHCDYEFAVAQAVYRSDVPAPAAFERIDVAGRHGIVYERLEGDTMLHILSKQPHRLLEMAHMMADLHTDVHQHIASRLPRWRDKFNWALDRAPLSDAQKSSIAQHNATLPDDDKVCHGDFHPDNIMFTPNGLRAIDWNNAFAGHPLADIAWTSLLFQISEVSGESDAQVAAMRNARAAFLDAYLARRLGADRAALNAWVLPVMVLRLADNIAEEHELLVRRIGEVLHHGV